MKYCKKEEIIKIVNESLDRAEEMWENTLEKLKIIANAQDTETNIPGHKYLGKDRYKSDQFLAIMIDMRNSTKHLIEAIGAPAKVSQMERVFYEVSALLPASATIIENADGGVTEYLGDGLLALFQFPGDKDGKDNTKKRDEICRKVFNVAMDLLEILKTIINPILKDRYNLPEIEIGIGMSYSPVIITHFGIQTYSQVKVIGRCIYDVSKLSKLNNEIAISRTLEMAWPTSKGGLLSFTKQGFDNNKITGYIVRRKEK